MHGAAWFAGFYLNELLLRLLARDDPYAALFDVYGGVVRVLAGTQGEALEPVLRAFELVLLRELGLLPGLAEETMTLSTLAAGKRYMLVPEGGLRQAAAGERAALTGAQWRALEQALGTGHSPQAYTATLRAAAPVALALKSQLRTLLQYHCGNPLLRTRQLMMDLQNL
jgi:DNA repair protein RecO (recombination protein O)